MLYSANRKDIVVELIGIYQGETLHQPFSNFFHMFKQIGIVVMLYAITQFFSDASTSFESALVATFQTIETAAVLSEAQLMR